MARTSSSSLHSRVGWPGALPDASTLLRAFDVIILSSRTEGTPMVLLEAMAVGIPVVTTSVGGIPDVVSDAEAWIAPPENPAALARLIDYARAHPLEAQQHADSARRRFAEAFTADSLVAQYDAIYGDALAHVRVEGQ
jgi:glycosyltransferase involved in cell wall biosynthesis